MAKESNLFILMPSELKELLVGKEVTLTDDQTRVRLCDCPECLESIQKVIQ